MKRILFISILCLSLSGCVGVFLAGVATGGAAVYDHRNIQQIAADQSLTHQIENYITTDLRFNQSNIVVASFNGTVLLTGQADDPSLRHAAEKIAWGIESPKAKRVYDEIKISAPSSMLVRSSDSWITTKIKTDMLATKNLKSGQIKVVTEDGNVYLMGIVTRRQANIAVHVARQISGVQRVVKLFEYTKTIITTS